MLVRYVASLHTNISMTFHLILIKTQYLGNDLIFCTWFHDCWSCSDFTFYLRIPLLTLLDQLPFQSVLFISPCNTYRMLLSSSRSFLLDPSAQNAFPYRYQLQETPCFLQVFLETTPNMSYILIYYMCFISSSCIYYVCLL